MRQAERRKIGPFYFVLQKISEAIGAELGVAVYVSLEGEGVPVIERTMYFEEQTTDHIDNFCQKFAYDANYREDCLQGMAHWFRVARFYEANARIMAEEQQLSEADAFIAGRELFHFIRRDLELIEQHPEYKAEMARQSGGEESALGPILSSLGQIGGLEILSACQGSKAIKVRERTIFIPSCHKTRATLVFARRPDEFLRYLRSGLLGRLHLATFGEDRIASVLPSENAAFMKVLERACSAYVRKHGHKTSRELSPSQTPKP